VEDNEGEARLLQEVFADVNLHVRLHVVTDGLEAMAFLRYQGRYLHVARPDLILLDLHMPKMDGLEVLASVKSDPWLQTIPIIVLTTSDSQGDIERSYRLMANCYLKKPTNLEEMEEVVRSLNNFWINQVRFHNVEQKSAPTAIY
jgi:two-component system, chemotaxis family, response regulator Rcp1